ncbi:MAG: IS110 family transposase [Vibrio sp.]|nr:IS110 family transposase [Vibrio sp.]
MNHNPYVSCGLDISSQKFDAYLMDQDENGVHHVFDNSADGVSECLAFLSAHSYRGKVVMESTGRYHELVATTLFTSGFPTYVINPLRTKKYQQAGIQKVKTDKQDSRMLAEMGIKEKKLDAFTCTQKELGIKKKIALIRSLEEKLQEMKAMIKNYASSQERLGNSLSAFESSLFTIIKDLDRKKDKIEKEIVEEVFPKQDQEATKAKEILTSISGISSYYAALIYSFYSYDKSKDADSWIAYSGLSVSIYESGKWKGAGKLSKRGNHYLRKRNYTAGWGAYMRDDAFNRYYYYLKKTKGRSHVEALTIIGKKVLRIAYYCLKTGTSYDPTILAQQMDLLSPSMSAS